MVRPDEARVFLATTENGLSEDDRRACAATLAVDQLVRDGSVELWARELHRRAPFDHIYTMREELVLRAAHLRRLLGLTSGLDPDTALAFRDKVTMKERARAAGLRVPRFRRLASPSCLIAFVDDVGFPVVVKPVLGAGSTNVAVLRNADDLRDHLARRLCGQLDSVYRMELMGETMAEEFVDAGMVQVNGLFGAGEIERAWVFEYTGTILGYTAGNAYGNVLVTRTDPRWDQAMQVARQLLTALAPAVDRLVFHIELFVDSRGEYTLCEVAARRAGGSIPKLVGALEGVGLDELSMRWSVGVEVVFGPEDPARVVGDVIVPLRVGRFLGAPDVCPVDGVSYARLADPGRVHAGFVPGEVSAAAHFLVLDRRDVVLAKLGAAKAWFDSAARYDQNGVRP